MQAKIKEKKMYLIFQWQVKCLRGLDNAFIKVL